MFKSFAWIASLAVVATAATAQVTDTTPVIEAKGAVLTKAEFEELLSSDPRYRGAASQAASRRALAINFGKAFALENEARNRRLDQDPSIRLKIRHATQQILAYELLAQIRRDMLKDEAKLNAIYEENKTYYSQPKVRHILIRTKGSEVALRPGAKDLTVDEARAKAVALRTQLANGADFAALARKESDDLGSRARGGDLGFIARGAMGAEFETAAYKLPVGTLSEVVRTDSGFHVLRVEERQPLPLAAVRTVIANDLAHKQAESIMKDGFTINDSYFSQ